jgi:hypothetical protein
MTLRRSFVSWHRLGLSAALAGAPQAGASRAALPATITLLGTSRASGASRWSRQRR